MSDFDPQFHLVDPSQGTVTPDTAVKLECNYTSQCSYKIYWDGQQVKLGKSTWDSPGLKQTTTFILECETNTGEKIQQSITVQVLGGSKQLLQKVVLTNGTQWQSIDLPREFSFFEFTLVDVACASGNGELVGRFQNVSANAYSGNGWGNDVGGNSCYLYNQQNMMNLWSPQREGPNANTGLYGTIHLINQSLLVCRAELYAPYAYQNKSAFCITASNSSDQGPLSSIQFAFGARTGDGGGVPSTILQFSRGEIYVYGWN